MLDLYSMLSIAICFYLSFSNYSTYVFKYSFYVCFVFCVFCVFCIVLCAVSPCVYSCLFRIFVQVYRQLPPGGNPVAINKYHIIYHIISYLIISYHIVSYHIISYHIISYRIISYHTISYHIISYHICHIISYHIVSYHIYQLMPNNASSNCMRFFNWMNFYHTLLTKHTPFNLWSPSHKNPLLENLSICCFFLNMCQIAFKISEFMPAPSCISSCSILWTHSVPHSVTVTTTNWTLITDKFRGQLSQKISLLPLQLLLL